MRSITQTKKYFILDGGNCYVITVVKGGIKKKKKKLVLLPIQQVNDNLSMRWSLKGLREY
jgi:hypothetical protein